MELKYQDWAEEMTHWVRHTHVNRHELYAYTITAYALRLNIRNNGLSHKDAMLI